MSDRLACGVAGAGAFGAHHARHYAGLPQSRLAAVFDPDPVRARGLADLHGAAAFTELGPFLDAVEAVSVTAPAVAHHAIARDALKRGRSVYVEKPLATRLEDAEELIAAADANGAALAVGHQERLVAEALGLFAAGARPLRLEAVRFGPPSTRNLDVSCVLDLMIHDLDLALALLPGDPLAVEAETLGGAGADAVRADIVFDDGSEARLETSRAAAGRERRMRLVYPAGVVEIDFLNRTVRDGAGLGLDPNFADSPLGRDPLGAALRAFVDRAAHDLGRGASRPADGSGAARLASARDAARALDLALAVEAAAGV